VRYDAVSAVRRCSRELRKAGLGLASLPPRRPATARARNKIPVQEAVCRRVAEIHKESDAKVARRARRPGRWAASQGVAGSKRTKKIAIEIFRIVFAKTARRIRQHAE